MRPWTELQKCLFIACYHYLAAFSFTYRKGNSIRNHDRTHNNHKQAASTSTMQSSRCKWSSPTRTDSYRLQKQKSIKNNIMTIWKELVYCLQKQLFISLPLENFLYLRPMENDANPDVKTILDTYIIEGGNTLSWVIFNFSVFVWLQACANSGTWWWIYKIYL